MFLVVSPYDAKTKLSALLDRAAAGEKIFITKNGVPRVWRRLRSRGRYGLGLHRPVRPIDHRPGARPGMTLVTADPAMRGFLGVAVIAGG